MDQAYSEEKNHIDLDLLHGIACLTVLWHDKVGPTLRSDVFFLGNL